MHPAAPDTPPQFVAQHQTPLKRKPSWPEWTTTSMSSVAAAAADMSNADMYAGAPLPATQTQPPLPCDALLDDIDVACYAHVNLSADWIAQTGEPGPSMRKKQRRVDSGFEECETTATAMSAVDMGHVYGWVSPGQGDEAYVGKGKGRMGAGVVTIE